MAGVNKYVTEDEVSTAILKIDETVEKEQLARLKEVKRTRDNRRVTQALNDLHAASKTDKNLMPYVIEAVKEYATEQELCDIWRDTYGEYREPAVRL